ncbi:hypothetical protein WMY93_008746 [Mugilogobius chulae]|uniref:RING-type domain-containing protein n=1 Tax=Mugilogobius chulae TaxID=88201 RepID=A0AAW0P9M9_9GOBI
MESGSEAMLQLAAEAFEAQNYELAAEIYECEAVAGNLDARAHRELHVRRADALALCGKLTEAFGVYRRAAEEQRLRPEQLDRLVDCLREGIRVKVSGRGQTRGRAGSESHLSRGIADVTSCHMCLSFLFEPVTLACGHCFCKRCLERERPLQCRECGASAATEESYRLNVVMSSVLSKLFPDQQRAGELRREGNVLYAEKKSEEALDKYQEAIHIAPSDHLLFSNRSQIHSSLKRLDEALSDANMAVSQAALLSEILAPVSDQVSDQVLDYSGILSSRSLLKNSTALLQCDSADLWACPVRSDECKVRGHVEAGLLKRKRHISEEDDEKTEEQKRQRTVSPGPEAVQTLDPTDVECSLCMRSVRSLLLCRFTSDLHFMSGG